MPKPANEFDSGDLQRLSEALDKTFRFKPELWRLRNLFYELERAGFTLTLDATPATKPGSRRTR